MADEALKPLDEGFNNAASSLTVSVEIPADKKREGFTYEKVLGYYFGGKVFATGTKSKDGKLESVDIIVIAPEKIEGKDGKLKFPDWNKVKSSSEEVYKYLDTYTSSKLDETFAKVEDAVKNVGDNDEQVNAVKSVVADLSKLVTTIMGKIDTEVLSGLSKVADYYEAAKDAYKKD